jgi:hypothetical protein
MGEPVEQNVQCESVGAEHLFPFGRDVKCRAARKAKVTAAEAMQKARVVFAFDPFRH